jgi:hypothetical protein
MNNNLMYYSSLKSIHFNLEKSAISILYNIIIDIELSTIMDKKIKTKRNKLI